MPEKEQPDGWGDDAVERITGRVNEILADDVVPEEAEEPEEPAEGDEPEAETTRAAAKPKAPAPKGAKTDRGTPAGTEEPEEELEPTFTLDGKVYTQSEVREMREGAMRQADYTRKTQALEQDRGAYRTEQQDRKDLNTLISKQTQLIELLVKRGSVDPDVGAEVDPETGLPAEAARDAAKADPVLAKQLAEVQKNLRELTDGIDQREKQREQDRHDDYLITNADRECDRLFRVFKVPKALQPLYKNSIFGADPNVRDGSGQVTAESIAAAVKREFTRIHSQTRNHIQAETAAVTDGLRRETPRKPQARGARPEKKPAAREKPKPWDSEANADEFIGRVAELGGGQGEE